MITKNTRIVSGTMKVTRKDGSVEEHEVTFEEQLMAAITEAIETEEN